MPGAVWDPLADDWSAQPRMVAHNFVCIHTMVGSLEGTDSLFRFSNGRGYDGTESHYGTGFDGSIRQWQDTSRQAEANRDGNIDVISIENADFGTGFPDWDTNDGSQVPAFRAEQVESIARILAWECSPAAHVDCPVDWACHGSGIPLALVPDTRPGRRGVAFHRQGIDPFRVAGGARWSLSTGKVCPGDRRIAQIPQIIARAQELMEGDDMPSKEEFIDWVREGVLSAGLAQSPGGIGPADLDRFLLRIADDTFAGKEQAEEARRMLGVMLGGAPPATDGEKAALAKLWGGPAVDEAALAAAVVAALQGSLARLSDADIERITTATADEIARRAAQSAAPAPRTAPAGETAVPTS